MIILKINIVYINEILNNINNIKNAASGINPKAACMVTSTVPEFQLRSYQKWGRKNVTVDSPHTSAHHGQPLCHI